MRRDSLIPSLVLGSLLFAAVASGQEYAALPGSPSSTADVDRRLTQMQQEIDWLRGRLDGQSASEPRCVPNAACCERPRGGWDAGCTLVFAKPHYKESFEATAIALPSMDSQLLGFEFDYDLAPRIWLGVSRDDGLGVRATYWQYDHSAQDRSFAFNGATMYSAQAMTVIFPAYITTATPGDVLSLASGLEVQTLDLEGTQTVCVGRLQALVSAGVRYASLTQESSAWITNSGFTTQELRWSRRFSGLGPTVRMELRRPLGDFGLEFFGAGGGALLFGKKDLYRTVAPDVVSPDPDTVTLDDEDEVVGCGGMELGLQWTRPLARGGNLFVRGAWEGQLWTDAGAPTLTFLGFEGFSMAFGITR